MKPGNDLADTVREHARGIYVNGAKRRGERRFTIRAGDVHRELAYHNRVPVVCSALRSREFLEENNLRLVGQTGPRSGQSTTVTFTYEFIERDGASGGTHPLLALRGMGREVFESLGGGEAFIGGERRDFAREKS